MSIQARRGEGAEGRARGGMEWIGRPVGEPDATNCRSAAGVDSAQYGETGEIGLHRGIVNGALGVPATRGFHEDRADFNGIGALGVQRRTSTSSEPAR